MEERINNFIKEYKELCNKYNLSLAHEDVEGGFIIEEYKEENIKWVESATDIFGVWEEKIDKINLMIQMIRCAERELDKGLKDEDRELTENEKYMKENIDELKKILKNNYNVDVITI